MSSRPAGARPRNCAGEKRVREGSPRPVAARLHQRHRRLVAVLGLPADIAHRLVQQDGDLLLLLAAGARVDLDARAAAPPAGPWARPAPSTRTQPRAIQSSASRREHRPSSAMRLFNRVVGGAGGDRAWAGDYRAAARAPRPLLRSASRSSTRTPPYSMRISALRLQRAQRLVDALARQAHQVGQFLLRDAQQLADAGVQHRVEQRGQAARHAHVGAGSCGRSRARR